MDAWQERAETIRREKALYELTLRFAYTRKSLRYEQGEEWCVVPPAENWSSRTNPGYEIRYCPN